MRVAIKIKQPNSQFDILNSISNPFYKTIISNLLDIIKFNDFKNHFIENNYIDLSDFYKKINLIQIKKNQEQTLKIFQSAELLVQKFDILTTLAWINLTSTKIIALNEIETRLNIKLDKNQFNELCYLSFENIDPYNIKNYLLPYGVEKNLILKINNDDFVVSPYLFYIIEQNIEYINKNVYIDDNTFYKIFINNAEFYKIANYFTFTKQQIQYAYEYVLEHYIDNDYLIDDFISFIEYNQRYKNIDIYKQALDLKEKIGVKGSVVDFLIKPEKILEYYPYKNKCKTIKEHIKLMQKVFTNKKQRYKILAQCGFKLDECSNEELAYIFRDEEKNRAFAIFINGLTNQEIEIFVEYLIKNNHFQTIKIMMYFLFCFNEQDLLLSIFKKNQFNPNF